MADEVKDSSQDSVQFRYLKSPEFRVVHANGAYGGLTPHAEIHLIIWSERPAIPDAVIHAVEADGTLGKEISVKGEGGAVRECQVDVVLDYGTAKAVHEWLGSKIGALEKLVEQAREIQKAQKTKEAQTT